MKSAIVSGFKAFIQQVKENNFELAKKTVEKNGFQVIKPTNKKGVHKQASINNAKYTQYKKDNIY